MMIMVKNYLEVTDFYLKKKLIIIMNGITGNVLKNLSHYKTNHYTTKKVGITSQIIPIQLINTRTYCLT